jgi:type IV pilus assembly protein PilM
VKTQSQAAVSALDEVRQKRDAAITEQRALLAIEDRRFQSLDLLRAVQSLLPRDPAGQVPKNPADRNELHVTSLDCQYFPDLATWFGRVKDRWAETHPAEEPAEVAPADPAAAPPAEVQPPQDAAVPAVSGPQGPGWVIQLKGHHYHNEDHHKPDESTQFVRSTIVKGLLGEGDPVTVSAGPLSGQQVPVKELGIGFPVIVASSPVQTIRVPRPDVAPTAAPVNEFGGPVAAVPDLELRRYDFILQFCWQPISPGMPKPAAPGPPAP